MDFGIALATDATSWQVTQRAEELGFSHAWFYDTQMLTADPFVAMAAAAIRILRVIRIFPRLATTGYHRFYSGILQHGCSRRHVSRVSPVCPAQPVTSKSS